MKNFLLILILLITTPTLAQDPYDQFVKTFVENYNKKDFAANYEMTAANFKNAVTLDYFSQILASTSSAGGEITRYELAEKKGQMQIFILSGKTANYLLSIVLDPTGKASGLFIKPDDGVYKFTSTERITRAMETWKKDPISAGLVVGVIQDGKLDLQFYGTTVRGKSIPPDANTVFEIGSISKPITGIVLHTLINDGKLKLEDPVNNFLPATGRLPQMNGKDVLIRHLATHWSCLPRMPGNMDKATMESENPYVTYGEKELLAYLPTVATNCELESKMEYSNLGAGLLGYVMTRAAGKSYNQLLQDRFVKPLKLKSFGVLPESLPWSAGTDEAGALQGRWDFTDVFVGAGGLDASAADMEKVLRFFMGPDNSPLGKAVKESVKRQLNSKGAGELGTFWVLQPMKTRMAVWHNGRTGGYNAFLGWLDGSQNGVFILSNNGSDVATTLGKAWLEKMGGN